MITVTVGGEEEVFTVHSNLLSAASPWFKTKIEREKQTSIRIESLNNKYLADAFEIYVTWLYTGTMCTTFADIDRRQVDEELRAWAKSEFTKSSADRDTEDDPITVTSREWPLLSGCIILGHRLEDHKFYNAAVDCLIEGAIDPGLLPSALAALLCENLDKMSPAIQLIVDFWVYGADSEWFKVVDEDEDVVAAPQTFWVAAAKELTENRSTVSESAKRELVDREPWLKDRCKYHIHKDGKKCT